MHEARPQAPNEAGQPADSRRGSDQQIQIENEKRLDAADLAGPVPDREITIVELGVDRVLDDLVVTAILGLRREGIGPAPASRRLLPRDDLYAAEGKCDGALCVGRPGGKTRD
jgi:hypothetical protein